MGRQDQYEKKWGDRHETKNKWVEEMQDKKNRVTRQRQKKWGDKMRDRNKWGDKTQDKKMGG